MNERDPKLEEALRAHLREEPPSALDARILAAAHRAVESAPRKVGPEATRPQRWWMPLAAAAAIGVIAIGVVQQVPKDAAIDATSVTGTTTNAPVQAPAPKVAEKVAPAEEKSNAPSVAQSQQPAPAVGETRSAPAAVAPPPPAPAPARDANVIPKKQKEAEMPRSTEPTVASPPPAVASPPPATAPAPAPSPFPAAPPQPLQKTELAASSEAKRDEVRESAREAPKESQVADARKDGVMNRQAAAGAAAPAPPAAPPAAAPAPQTSSFAAQRARSQETVGALAQQSAKVGTEYDTLARDPEAWIVRIRKLRDEGNTSQAVRELREFRALVPDAEKKLPADLKSLQP